MLDHASLKVVHGLVNRSFGTANCGVSDLEVLDLGDGSIAAAARCRPRPVDEVQFHGFERIASDAAASTIAGPRLSSATRGPAVDGSASLHELDHVKVAPYIDPAIAHSR